MREQLQLYWPAGSLAKGNLLVDLSPADAGWDYCGLAVVEIPAGGAWEWESGAREGVLLSLAGGCEASVDGRQFTLAGRKSVFTGVSDLLYIPAHSHLSVFSGAGGRFALPSSVASTKLQPWYCAARDVPVEVRGAQSATRQVNNFFAPEVFSADRLMAVEVLVPGGNWGSYPPHKHDHETGDEAKLEEIYYFEIDGEAGFGMQRLYTTDGSIDLTATVFSGDVVLIPKGYHGPSAAAPDFPMYFLNVLAGPGKERRMTFCDDPTYSYIRKRWEGQEVDTRVPMTGPASSGEQDGR